MAIILIVDDAVENIRLLKGLLQPLGQIVFALDGEGALRQVQAHKPDIVLLDVMLPGIDGYEVCRRLKAGAETASIPVVFITGADRAGEEARGIALGAAAYLSKPFDPDAVRACVAGLLGRPSA